MPPSSAGILMYQQRAGELWVLLGHPGGPYWHRRDMGAWMIPKGELVEGETPEQAALREFAEETGFAPDGPLEPLGTLQQHGGKQVEVFALAGDCDPERLRSNRFELEWPPHSGCRATFPELDRLAWLPLDQARGKILPSQAPLLDRLHRHVASGSTCTGDLLHS